MKKVRKLLVVLICLICVLSACGEAPAPAANADTRWQEQYDLGVRYLEEGNYEEAIIAFSAAIEIDSRRAPAYVGRGNAYVLSGENDENLACAQADYGKAIELAETNVDAYLGLADVYIRQGEYDKALEILRVALEKVGGNQDVSEKIANLEKGEISDASGKVRRKSVYSRDGVLEYTYDYSYNEDGFEVKFYCTSYLDGISDYYAVVDEFDERGYPYRRNYYDVNETDSDAYSGTYDIIIFNDLKQKVELYKYYKNGDELNAIFKYYYDELGRQTRYEQYDQTEKLTGYWEYCYDENGVSIGEKRYSADGELLGSIEYS